MEDSYAIKFIAKILSDLKKDLLTEKEANKRLIQLYLDKK